MDRDSIYTSLKALYQDLEKRGSCKICYANTPLAAPPKNHSDLLNEPLCQECLLSWQGKYLIE